MCPRKECFSLARSKATCFMPIKMLSPETVRKALDIAQASEFVFDEEEGLEADISQGGTNVSGGQRQRLINCPSAGQKTADLTFLMTVFLPWISKQIRLCEGN